MVICLEIMLVLISHLIIELGYDRFMVKSKLARINGLLYKLS